MTPAVMMNVLNSDMHWEHVIVATLSKELLSKSNKLSKLIHLRVPMNLMNSKNSDSLIKGCPFGFLTGLCNHVMQLYPK